MADAEIGDTIEFRDLTTGLLETMIVERVEHSAANKLYIGRSISVFDFQVTRVL